MEQLKKLFLSLLALLTSTIMYAQSEISGTVVDVTGETVIGATVMEKGTSNGTITDFDGNFKIKVATGKTLVFSYIGYETQELPAQNGMQIVMKDNAKELAEVVVTGYQTQRRADLTGSVSVVETKELKTSSDTDPMRALQGKVPGMTITSNGSPVGAGTVRIRGIGSFNSSQDPLFVIDGVPTTTNLNTLNMNDIESMQVLKDAASASIYGSRAANGVIIITTRSGKKGDKVKVDFSANLTAQFYNKQSMMNLSNTAEYATAMAQAAMNDGLDPEQYANNYGLTLHAQDGVKIQAYNPATGEMQAFTVNGKNGGYLNDARTMRFSDTDWLKEISRTGFSQNYDLSISNATEKSSALFSFGYKKNNGILKYTDFESFSGRINTSFKVNKMITVGENATITYSNQVDCQPLENALKMANNHFTSSRLWNDYALVSPNSVHKPTTSDEREALTNIIQLVRFAYHQITEMECLSVHAQQYFNLWCGQRNNEKTEKQREVMRQDDFKGYLSDLWKTDQMPMHRCLHLRITTICILMPQLAHSALVVSRKATPSYPSLVRLTITGRICCSLRSLSVMTVPAVSVRTTATVPSPLLRSVIVSHSTSDRTG